MKFTFMCKGKKPSITGRGVVAIIGSGPAGLAAAGYLACQGYEVNVYDKMPIPGGMMYFAIPTFRVPRESVDEGVEDLRDNFGVKFILNTKVFCMKEGEHRPDEGDVFFTDLVDLRDLVEEYDAVLITTGTWRSRRLGIEGEFSQGVYPALDYLFRIYTYEQKLINVPPPKPSKVVVIGGGLSAIDAVEESLKRGVKEVYLVYRRTPKEAPAGEAEIKRMIKLGAKFIELASPKRVISRRGRVEGIEFIRMKLGEPDESGRPRPIPIPGTEFTIETEAVITAIGEIPTPPFEDECLGIKVDRRNRIVVDKNFNTGHPKVFAAGDVVLGPSLIGKALSHGIKAATALHNVLIKRRESQGFKP